MAEAARHFPGRLLTEPEARSYLGGCNPASLLSPVKIGRMVRWDREAIDRRLNELSGCADTPRPDNDADAALEEWERSHGGPARRP